MQGKVPVINGRSEIIEQLIKHQENSSLLLGMIMKKEQAWLYK